MDSCALKVDTGVIYKPCTTGQVNLNQSSLGLWTELNWKSENEPHSSATTEPESNI
jgi:hypothetical protein